MYNYIYTPPSRLVTPYFISKVTQNWLNPKAILDLHFSGRFIDCSDSHGWMNPLLNVQKTMERSTVFNRKIHYFYGHFPKLF